MGTAVGTILGAFLGAQLGDGPGRQIASLFGALGGAYLGGMIGEGLSDEDQDLAERSTYEALEAGETMGWENPDTGVRGYTEPGDEFEYDPSGLSDEGDGAAVPTVAEIDNLESAPESTEERAAAQRCRPARITIILSDGEQTQRHVIACRDETGAWRIQPEAG